MMRAPRLGLLKKRLLRTRTPNVVLGRRWSPPAAPGILPPDLRPLRQVMVPWPRLEVAESLVLHLVELGVELDNMTVWVVMVRRDVVPWTAVTQRSPYD